MENKINNKARDFIKNEVLIIERNLFIFRILAIVVGYTGITLWLNAIRATTSIWFVWVLIVIQLTLYFLFFFSSLQRSKVCGLNKNLGMILFVALTVLGRVNDWELLIIPLLLVIMLIFSTKNKNVSDKRKYLLSENSQF